MELTLKRLLEQAKFTTTRKGYDQDEVDDFLDRAVAMATKVEARLTQALADADTGTAAAEAAPGRSDEEIQAEIDATVEERVQARIADIEAAAAQRTMTVNDASAEEAARTLVLAQRTADAAMAEAREEAADLLARAREQAAELTGAAERASEEERRTVEQEAERARSEARARLAEEIHTLEDARNGLRTDVSMLEGHVEEQRLQLRSTVAELQRLLDDPSAFRLAPAPPTRDVAVPDLDPPASTDDSAAAPVGEVADEAENGPTDDDAIDATDSAGDGGFGGSVPMGAPLGAGEIEIEITASPDAGGPSDRETIDLTGPDGPTNAAASPPAGDRPAIGSDPAPDPDALLDVGPPTAPVSAIELDFDIPPPRAPEPSGRVDLAFGGPIGSLGEAGGGDDAFLAELRKAMADEEPLGPRDAELGGGQAGFLDEERKGWRFGKRR